MEEKKPVMGSLSKEERRTCRRRSFSKEEKPEIAVEKCEEEIVFFNAQTELFFHEMRGLSNEGLNPREKSELAVANITDADVEDLFGKCTKFRTTNTFLHPDARHDLMDLYVKIYGSDKVTNNEFMGWMVKGYIANLKNFKVNWAAAARVTALEKAERAQRALMKFRNPVSEDTATFSGGVSTSTLQQGNGVNSGLGFGVKKEGACSMLGSLELQKGKSLCPYGVSEVDIEKSQDVASFEKELLAIALSKVRFVEVELKRISEKLIGLQFSMEDRVHTAKEDKEKATRLEFEVKAVCTEVVVLEGQASLILIGTAEHDEIERSLDLLRQKRDLLERKLDSSISVAESSRERAIECEDLYQDVNTERWRAESNLSVLKQEIVEMERHIAALDKQLVEMKMGGGLSLWPKPALHPSVPADLDTPSTLQLHPCAFCNRGYPFFDIVIAPCKHIFHIFCLAALVQADNHCSCCGEVFHPSWWRVFGFRRPYETFEEEVAKLDLDKKLEEIKESLKEHGSLPVPTLIPSAIKQSEWGSSGSIHPVGTQLSGGLSANTTGLGCQAPIPSGLLQDVHNVDIIGGNSGSGCEEVDSPVKADAVITSITVHSNTHSKSQLVVSTGLLTSDNSNADVGQATAASSHPVLTEVAQTIPTLLCPPVDKGSEGVDSEETNGKSNLGSSRKPNGMPKLRYSLLKRPSDMPLDNEMGRKKLLLSMIDEALLFVPESVDPPFKQAEPASEPALSDDQATSSGNAKKPGRIKGGKPKTTPDSAQVRVSSRLAGRTK